MSVEKIDAEIAALKEKRKLEKLEEAFVAKKAAGKLTSKDRYDLDAARVDYRLNHRQPATGAAPDAIGATSDQGEVG